MLEMSEERWSDVMAVNLTGVFACAQAAGRIMAGAALGLDHQHCVVGGPARAAGACALLLGEGGVIRLRARARH